MPATDVQPDSTETTEASCASCGHPEASHDAIALRYCAATAVGNATGRGCVCGSGSRPVTPPRTN